MRERMSVCVCVFNSLLYKLIFKQNRIKECRYPKCQRERYIPDNIKYINIDIHKTSDGIQSGQRNLAGKCFHFLLTSALENAPPYPLQNHPE